jgi:hypothetical protein
MIVVFCLLSTLALDLSLGGDESIAAAAGLDNANVGALTDTYTC